MVPNALAAAACGLALGVSPAECAVALKGAHVSAARMETFSTPEGALVVNDAYNAMASWTYPMYYDTNLTIRFRIFLPYDDNYKEGFYGQFIGVALYDTNGEARLVMRFLMDMWEGAPSGFTYVSDSNQWTLICGTTAGRHECAIGLVKGSSTWSALFDGVFYSGMPFSVTGWNASDLSKIQFNNALREEPVVAMVDDVKVDKLGIPTPPQPNLPPVAVLAVDSTGKILGL